MIKHGPAFDPITGNPVRGNPHLGKSARTLQAELDDLRADIKALIRQKRAIEKRHIEELSPIVVSLYTMRREAYEIQVAVDYANHHKIG